MKSLGKSTIYDIYLIALCTLSFLSYIGKIDAYILYIFIGLMILAMLTKRSFFYVFPAPLITFMSFLDLRHDIRLILIYASVGVPILIIDLIKNRKLTKVGYMTLPLLILVLVSILSLVNAASVFVWFEGLGMTLVMLTLYAYFVNAFEQKDDNYINISKVFLYFSLLVTAQIFYNMYVYEGDVFDLIRTRGIDMGWENINTVVYVNLMAIPLIGYLITKVKVKVPYMLMGLIVIVGVFLTLSRSSILSVAVYLVLVLPTMFITEKRKMSLLIQGLLFFMILAIVFYYFGTVEFVDQCIELLKVREWTRTSDRTALIEVAITQFKLHPLLGTGGIHTSSYYLTGVNTYHNMIAQISTLGIAGFLTFGFIFFRKFKLILVDHSTFKWYALILLIVTAFVNGMFQPMYLYSFYWIYLIFVLALIDVNTKKEA